MTCATVGVQMVGTITVGASGGVDSTGTIVPARSCAPFKNLSISIVPLDKASSYFVYVYHDGELVESHDLTTAANTVCHMAYPNIMFPANVGTNTIPQFYADHRKDYYGIPIRVVITNYKASPATFYVYSNFEEFDHCRFASITQES
jgi:hypothetical protein